MVAYPECIRHVRTQQGTQVQAKGDGHTRAVGHDEFIFHRVDFDSYQAVGLARPVRLALPHIQHTAIEIAPQVA